MSFPLTLVESADMVGLCQDANAWKRGRVSFSMPPALRDKLWIGFRPRPAQAGVVLVDRWRPEVVRWCSSPPRS